MSGQAQPTNRHNLTLVQGGGKAKDEGVFGGNFQRFTRASTAALVAAGVAYGVQEVNNVDAGGPGGSNTAPIVAGPRPAPHAMEGFIAQPGDTVDGLAAEYGKDNHLKVPVTAIAKHMHPEVRRVMGDFQDPNKLAIGTEVVPDATLMGEAVQAVQPPEPKK